MPASRTRLRDRLTHLGRGGERATGGQPAPRVEVDGPIAIADAPQRERVLVEGVIRTLILRPRGGVPALEAELHDRTGSLTLLWLGRRRIAGIVPGSRIRVEGRIGVHGGEQIIYNPRYELRA